MSFASIDYYMKCLITLGIDTLRILAHAWPLMMPPFTYIKYTYVSHAYIYFHICNVVTVIRVQKLKRSTVKFLILILNV